MPDATGLQTTFKNPTSGTLNYPFLGSHGMILAAGATFAQDGGPFDHIRKGTAGVLDRKAMKNALVNGLLAIVTTPSAIIEDPVTGIVKAVVDTTAAVALGNPTWGAFDAIAPTIASSTPAAAATGVATSATVAVVFTEPVSGGTIAVTRRDTGVAIAGGSIAATNSNKTQTKTLGSAMTSTKVYDVLVAGWVDGFGNTMLPATFSFTIA